MERTAHMITAGGRIGHEVDGQQHVGQEHTIHPPDSPSADPADSEGCLMQLQVDMPSPLTLHLAALVDRERRQRYQTKQTLTPPQRPHPPAASA